jgi:hypothetical protein
VREAVESHLHLTGAVGHGSVGDRGLGPAGQGLSSHLRK